MFKFRAFYSRLKALYLLLGLLLINTAFAQNNTTLESCYELAKSNYPLIQQLDIIEKTKDYNLDNVTKGYFPKISIKGQATYQSAVTEISIDLPNISIPSPSKDQYKIYGEVYMPLTERVNLKSQKTTTILNAEVEKRTVAVELYQIKERINQLYFSILLIDEQIIQFELLKKDLQTALDKVNAAIQNGTATTFNSDILVAEMLNIDQKFIELSTNRKAFLKMLSMMTKQDFSSDTPLEKPNINPLSIEVNRPELKLFHVQTLAIEAQGEFIDNRRIPSLGLFAQGGLGRPGLNFLSDNFELYYIGGLRFNWNLSSFYHNKNDKAILALKRSSVQFKKETFLLNINLKSSQQAIEIGKYKDLIESDKSIIEVRERLRTTANVQLENGIISALDYTRYLNAEYQAKQNLSIHQIYLLKAQYDYKTTLGN